MAITRIEYGALASSELMNDNFEYLDNRISQVAESITAENSGIYSNIASVNTALAGLSDTLRPIGQPIIRLDDTIFSDEIRLEGAEVSRATYSDLFAIYGITYGGGDGITTFNLPDFRSRTLWGAENSGYLEAGLPNILGMCYVDGADSESFRMLGAFYNYTPFNAPGKSHNSNQSIGSIGFDASMYCEIYGASETVQPPSVKVRVVTRYK